ncbi:MAG: hypothetical protein ACI4HI_07100 [Lachnospiraceae bacterium]
MKTTLFLCIVLYLPLLLFGGYICFAGAQMKRTGKVSSWLADEKELNKKQSDENSFVKAASVPTILFGGCAILTGITGIVDTLLTPIGLAVKILLIVFLLYAIVYCACLQKWRQEFLKYKLH